MKRLIILTGLLFCSFMLFAQDRISLFIGNANRYAAIDLSDFQRRLSIEYDVDPYSLHEYYRHCGRNWGNVGLVLEIAKASHRSVEDICRYYERHRHRGWNHILLEMGIRPNREIYRPFMDRVSYHSDCWHEYYCRHHGARPMPHRRHEHMAPPPPPRPQKHYKEKDRWHHGHDKPHHDKWDKKRRDR